MTIRKKVHLVSEARPIPWNRLTTYEQGKLREANDWMKLALADAALPRERRLGIDPSRAGHVLFIDGPRGSGKTSLMLTLLSGWDHADFRDPAEANGLRLSRGDCGGRDGIVLLPILDFDPLPKGMPLHGWLLEPWQKLARKLDANGPFAMDDADLTEAWSDLYDRVVLGWGGSQLKGNSVVDQSLKFREQSSGWTDTPGLWRKFVDDVVARCCVHRSCDGRHVRQGDGSPNRAATNDRSEQRAGASGAAGHPYLFVIAIDDIDLQVEQVPDLLHAIRLFDHPNVAYVLTGNFEHLELVMELAYLERHERHGGALGRDLRRRQIRDASADLAHALLEKALPSHSRVSLEEITVSHFAKWKPDGVGDQSPTVGDLLKDFVPEFMMKTVADRSLGTARWLQHALDRSRPSPAARLSETADTQAHEIIAEICGTRLLGEQARHTTIAAASQSAPAEAEKNQRDDERKERDSGREAKELVGDQSKTERPPALPAYDLWGELTTDRGPSLRSYPGDGLAVVVSERIGLVWRPVSVRGGARSARADDSHSTRAALIQLLVEGKQATAPRLSWQPDAGPIYTEVDWHPPRSERGKAVFYWPWAATPTVAEALGLPAVMSRLCALVPGATSLTDITETFVAAWLLRTHYWSALDMWARRGESKPSLLDYEADRAPTRLDEILEQLRKISLPDEDERLRWKAEVALLLAAPYFGIRQKGAWKAPRGRFDPKSRLPNDVLSPLLGEAETKDTRAVLIDRIATHQERAITNAILCMPAARKLAPDVLDEWVAALYEQMRRRWPDNQWWSVAPLPKRFGRSGQ